jgi:hypothetical protein
MLNLRAVLGRMATTIGHQDHHARHARRHEKSGIGDLGPAGCVQRVVDQRQATAEVLGAAAGGVA